MPGMADSHLRCLPGDPAGPVGCIAAYRRAVLDPDRVRRAASALVVAAEGRLLHVTRGRLRSAWMLAARPAHKRQGGAFGCLQLLSVWQSPDQADDHWRDGGADKIAEDVHPPAAAAVRAPARPGRGPTRSRTPRARARPPP